MGSVTLSNRNGFVSGSDTYQLPEVRKGIVSFPVAVPLGRPGYRLQNSFFGILSPSVFHRVLSVMRSVTDID